MNASIMSPGPCLAKMIVASFPADENKRVPQAQPSAGVLVQDDGATAAQMRLSSCK